MWRRIARRTTIPRSRRVIPPLQHHLRTTLDPSRPRPLGSEQRHRCLLEGNGRDGANPDSHGRAAGRSRDRDPSFPVRRPVALCQKGANASRRSSSVMPGPSSMTWISTYAPTRAERSITVLSGGLTSSALSMRLSRICSRCPGTSSAVIDAGPARVEVEPDSLLGREREPRFVAFREHSGDRHGLAYGLAPSARASESSPSTSRVRRATSSSAASLVAALLRVQSLEAKPERRERRAQLMAGVGDEAAL